MSAVPRPIDTFQKRATALDAAMVICRAAPKKGPVHNLRTATRCVEAQLTLLDLLRGLPPHMDQAEEVRERLKKVHQAAGTVRDLDVQSDLIHGDVPAKNEVRKSSWDGQMRREAMALRKQLKEQREHEAIKLVRVLRAEEQRVALALLNLQNALKPAKDRSATATQLTTSIERWFRANTAHYRHSAAAGTRSKRDSHVEVMRAIKMLDEYELHKLRKAAKLCRYMAESLPPGCVTATKLADQFRAIQEAGGHWHDWLLLHKIVAKHKGRYADLTQRYAKRENVTLADYRQRLAALLPGAGPTKRANMPVL